MCDRYNTDMYGYFTEELTQVNEDELDIRVEQKNGHMIEFSCIPVRELSRYNPRLRERLIRRINGRTRVIRLNPHSGDSLRMTHLEFAEDGTLTEERSDYIRKTLIILTAIIREAFGDLENGTGYLENVDCVLSLLGWNFQTHDRKHTAKDNTTAVLYPEDDEPLPEAPPRCRADEDKDDDVRFI